MSDHDSAFEETLASHGAVTAQKGVVALAVIRVGGGEHECPEKVTLSSVDGIIGDRWNRVKDPDGEAMVTLMMSPVAKTVVGDKPLHLPGDNFLVTLELTEDALPVGTRLRIGSAVLEVSQMPHTGCAKFSERFGSEALRWINRPDNRKRRLRGVNCKIVEDGEAGVGDTVEFV